MHLYTPLSFLKRFFNQKPYWIYIILFTVSFLIFTWLQTTPTLADPDSFYHIKLAMLMQEKLDNGDFPVIQDFPWLQFTTLKNVYTDHHFLYHLLLLPIVKYYGPFSGSKLATIILCAFLITLFYWLLKHSGIKHSLILTLLLFASPGFIFRISLVKAQALALIIFFLVLWAIFNRKYLLILLLSFIYVWSYGGWILALIVVCFYIIADALSRLLQKIPKFNLSFIIYYLLFIAKSFLSKKNILLILAVLAGLTFGIVTSPYFPKNLNFYFQQVFQISLLNDKSVVSIGAEWYASNFTDFFIQNILILAAWLIASAWFLYTIKFQTKKSWTLFFLSVSFLFFALRSARNIEYFAPLALMFSGFAFAINPFSSQSFRWRTFFQKMKKFLVFPNPLTTILVTGYIIIVLFVSGKAFAAQLNFVQKGLSDRFSFYYLKGVSYWLEKNTPQGSTIFHSSWDEFPMLFYHNHHNYYVVGLDATFMYNYDKFLYQLWRDITTGKDRVGLAYKIKKFFNSEYILVTKRRHEKFEKILKHQKGLESVYEDEEAQVFRIVE